MCLRLSQTHRMAWGRNDQRRPGTARTMCAKTRFVAWKGPHTAYDQPGIRPSFVLPMIHGAQSLATINVTWVKRYSDDTHGMAWTKKPGPRCPPSPCPPFILPSSDRPLSARRPLCLANELTWQCTRMCDDCATQNTTTACTREQYPRPAACTWSTSRAI